MSNSPTGTEINPGAGPRRLGMATASMVLGILGIITGCVGIGFLLAIVGLVLGIIALIKINTSPGALTGRGFAITGIVTSGVAILLIPILALFVAILLPSLGRARELANRSACAANLRGIMQSMNVYAVDNSDAFPVVLPGDPGNYNGNNSNGPAPQITETSTAGSFSSAQDALNGLYKSGATPNQTNQAGNEMANVWILVLNNYTSPKQYICRSDPWAAKTAAQLTDSSHQYFQNFNAPANPDLTYSYSFAYPWNAAPIPNVDYGNSPSHVRVGAWWRETTDSSLPLVSDIAPLNGSGSPAADVTSIPPASAALRGRKPWNSPNHQREGQNIGFADGHAEFLRTPAVGQNNDNIFTQNGVAGAALSAHPDVGTPVTTPGSIGADYTGGASAPFDIILVPVANLSTGQRQ